MNQTKGPLGVKQTSQQNDNWRDFVILSGLDKVIKKNDLLENLGRVGVVANQTSATSEFEPTADAVYRISRNTKGTTVSAVFGAQHGYYQTEQDNMLETPDTTYTYADGHTVPLYSLYSETRIPTDEQMEQVDTLIVDLFDIGCRVYTYMLTLAGCLKAAAKHGKRVVVLDRPNPLGLSYKSKSDEWERVGGDVLDLKWHSFVGWYAIPMQHGLSMGELGKHFIEVDKLNVDYCVIKAEGLFRRTQTSELRKTHFILPSPNIPCWESSFLFPAFVMLEGTNISEGRGSTMPFQIVGAPYLDVSQLISFLEGFRASSKHGTRVGGLRFRRHDFRPTFNKHMGSICHGMQSHIVDGENVDTFALGIYFLTYACAHHSQNFKWKDPGYEYNYKDNPILLILGQEKWLTYFESLRLNGWNAEALQTLNDYLSVASLDAQKFAEATIGCHLYKAE